MASRGEIINLLGNEKFKGIVLDLYGIEQLEIQILRYEVLIEEFYKNFNGNIDALYSSPGRVELCGNHTDHNNGKVLCAAVNIDTIAAVQARNDGIIKIASKGFVPVEVDTKDLVFNEKEQHTSKALVKGVLRYLTEKGYKVGGFNAATISNVFRGAGVSSSAAFEVLVGEIINDLYNNGDISKMDKARAGQFAEYAYFNKPCGLMDQSAVSLGGVSFIDFEDYDNPIVNNMKWNTELALVIVNTGGDHSDLTAHYSSIREDMESVAKYFGYKTLRAIPERDFFGKIAQLRNKLSGRAILRAMHFFEENNRVDMAGRAVMYNDIKLLTKMINESGDSSYKKLQNCYVPGDVNQNIPLAVAISKHFEGVRAARVHGGGFEGSILVFSDKDKVKGYSEYMKGIYGDENVYIVNIRNSGTMKVNLI